MAEVVRGVGGVGGRPRVPTFVWAVEQGARRNLHRLSRKLRKASPGLYRDGDRGQGLLLIDSDGNVRRIKSAAELVPVIVDRLRIRIVKDGKTSGDMPSSSILNAALRSDVFLDAFPPVDRVTRHTSYRADFSPMEPGYDASERILFLGKATTPANSVATIKKFLDVLAFATPADLTNAVAAALTAILAWFWAGAKPLILITATRSHAGKGTVADFICGSLRRAQILYESQDWPMQSQLQRQLSGDHEIRIIEIDNVRIDSAGGRSNFIRSGFLESFVTSPEVALSAAGAGQPVRVSNHFIVIINTNDGAASPDLLNRALPIHLAPTGNLFERPSPIGNPKLEFLPAHRDDIESELHGMIARWLKQGCPLDDSVRHPMIQWARTIGGILKVNGFSDFLGNYSATRISDDPVRSALALLAAARPGKALRPSEWAQVAKDEGLTKRLIGEADRGSDRGEERGMGVVLARHLAETFAATTETERLKVRLQGGYQRWERGGKPHKRYEFVVLDRESLPFSEPTDRAKNVAPAGNQGTASAAVPPPQLPGKLEDVALAKADDAASPGPG